MPTDIGYQHTYKYVRAYMNIYIRTTSYACTCHTCTYIQTHI